MAAQIAATAAAGRPKAAIAALEHLHTEIVHYFAGRDALGKQEALEALGFAAGERLAERASADKPRFAQTLDIVKFIGKDLWGDLFRKQIDKLQINNKGTFVIHDTEFRFLRRLSSAALDEQQLRARAMDYAHFTAGLIRGVLSNLGVKATVRADVPRLPVVVFNIVDERAAAAAAAAAAPASSPAPTTSTAAASPA
jgi:hypothetical protein